MTLKEKLCNLFGGLNTETVNELEQIADDFAIGFAQNLIEEPISTELLKELLKIYKKEKGL